MTFRATLYLLAALAGILIGFQLIASNFLCAANKQVWTGYPGISVSYVGRLIIVERAPSVALGYRALAIKKFQFVIPDEEVTVIGPNYRNKIYTVFADCDGHLVAIPSTQSATGKKLAIPPGMTAIFNVVVPPGSSPLKINHFEPVSFGQRGYVKAL